MASVFRMRPLRKVLGSGFSLGRSNRLLNSSQRPTISQPSINNSYSHSFHSSSKLLIDDPYKTLGVDKNASASDIKKTYYKLAKKYHPDINKEEGAEAKFHDIQGAYEILSDPEKKQQYDQFGSSAFDQGGPGGAGGFGGFQGNPFAGFNQGGFSQGGFNFEDLFGQAFRGAGQQSYATEFRGSNIEILKTITLKEAVFGIKNLKLNYKALDNCSTCNASGLKQGKKKSSCQTCGGTGSQVHYSHAGYQMASTCSTCEGTGVTIKKSDACSSCHGEGVTESSKATEIDLPPGLLDGQALRLSGLGDSPKVTSGPGIHLRKGDLNVRIRISKDPRYSIKGSDIVYDAEIPYTTAALGGIIEVPTVDGPILRLRVTQGTETGKRVAISEKGFPIRNNIDTRGNLIVNFKVRIPKPNSAAQTALLEALAQQLDDVSATRSESWSTSTKSDSKDNEGSKDINDSKDHPSNLKKIENFLSDAFKRITHKKDE